MQIHQTYQTFAVLITFLTFRRQFLLQILFFLKSQTAYRI